MKPVSCDVRDLLANYNKGNFGLWFNKFVDLENDLKTPKDAVDTYLSKYNEIKNFGENLLKEKHVMQYYLCESLSDKYEILTIRAKLKTPLITGIGQTHPNEVGMTFDHTLGIPYIPASAIKGIVRFAHTLGLIENLPAEKIKIDDEGEYFDDGADWTYIPKMFGKGGDKGNVGRVIFLDAYPEKTPKLKSDIMTPHYGKYYSDNQAPGDYIDPTPIKFLAVDKGNIFIFRILIEKKHNKLDNGKTITELIQNAVNKMLINEGIGAKTAVGYGRFENVLNNEPDWIIKEYEDKFETEEKKLEKEKKKFIDRIKKAKKESNEIDSIFSDWQKDENLKDDKEIAKLLENKVKKKKANKEFTASYKIICEILEVNIEKTQNNQQQNYDNKSNVSSEEELKKYRRKLKKANTDRKKNRILRDCPKEIREILKKEFNL